jgi:hypothetical protein
MLIDRFSDGIDIDSAIEKGDTLLAVISFDGSHAIIGHLDECMEHHILLAKAGLTSLDIDKYFRIMFDKNSADWTFVCPPDYMGLEGKPCMVSEFYKDGLATISAFMAEMGLLVSVKIPKRYRRRPRAV